MDANKHRLFIGCRKPQRLIVMSTQDGKVDASLPIGAGVDATAVHEGQAFASCRDGFLVVAAEKAGKTDLVQIVKTPAGARTMGLDPGTHQIYLPTVEFEGPSAARPEPKLDSFMIVVVGWQQPAGLCSAFPPQTMLGQISSVAFTGLPGTVIGMPLIRLLPL